MVRVLTICALGAALATFALAETFNGKLVDSACYDQSKGASPCDPSATTASFALVVSSQVYKLDDAGNAKAAEALRTRADRSTDPAKPMSSEIKAKVTGTKSDGNILKVEKIDVE